MKKLPIIVPIIIFTLLGALIFVFMFRKTNGQSVMLKKQSWWDIQSIDTMKYSRDVAREKAKDTTFDTEIDTQVRLISETGATHVAIATPYAEEFLPFLKRWIAAARKYELKVWFRGNVPGWEGWFDYENITREEHIRMIREFILANGELFEEGDIFSSCPECENGGPGDPRNTGDATGHRKFLIDEYRVTSDAFRKIGKNVRSNFAPMNGDVANLIMDKDTTRALGGIVVIDHYVGDKQKLAADIKEIAEKSGGRVILGEFGAPIPDIHGDLDPTEQALWIEEALNALAGIDELEGINYWTGFGGSTRLWEGNYKERPAVEVIKKYFKPVAVNGKVLDETGRGVGGAKISLGGKITSADSDGKFIIAVIEEAHNLQVEAPGYYDQQIPEIMQQNLDITLAAKEESFIFKLRKMFYKIFSKFL